MTSSRGATYKIAALFGANTKSMGGCEAYRIIQPLAHLAMTRRWEVGLGVLGNHHNLIPFDQFDAIIMPRLYLPDETDGRFGKYIESMMSIGLLDGDTDTPFVDVIKSLGVKVIYEVDDDFTNKHRVVPGGGEGAMKMARASDAITVTTPYLKKVMEEETGLPVFVLPNCIDRRLWSDKVPPLFRPESPDALVIGLTGSTTHGEDWKVLQDVVPALLEQHKHVIFALGGYHPDYFDSVQSESMLRLKGVEYARYPSMIKSFDIVLAPLDPNDRFNWSKSAIKAVEGMAAHRKIRGRAAGAAVLASKGSGVYERVIRHAYNGALVEHTPDAWYEALDDVIRSKGRRERYAINGYAWVEQNAEISRKRHLWEKTYKQILQL